MLKNGFKAVGKDFPVFLHPKTHEEYALARTERKTAPGYHGFAFHASPEVTLEQDLARRDLTINAIARGADGQLIDPYNGQADLAAKVLRHVGPAFAEDPVRILRLARFAARFTAFTAAPETLALMRTMIAAGEVDHLVPERVWQELAKGLMEAIPSRMIMVLRECGALARLLPELDRLFGVPQRADYHPEVDTGIHTLMALDLAAQQKYTLPVRWAVLLHDLGKGTTPTEILPRHHGHEARSLKLAEEVCARLKVPADCRDLALLTAKYHGMMRLAVRDSANALRPESMVDILEKTDAFRRPERFMQLLQACECDHRGRLGMENNPYPAAAIWQNSLSAAHSIDAGSIANSASHPTKIRALIHAARVQALKQTIA